MLNELTLARTDREVQIEGLKEELVYLKKTMRRKSILLWSQVGAQGSMEVDSSPGTDLTKILSDII